MLTNKPVFVRYAELKYLRKKLPKDIIVLKKKGSPTIVSDIPAIREACQLFVKIRNCKR